MGWLIALAGICLLAVIPLGFRAVYKENNPGVFVLIGPFKVRVYPTGTKRSRSGKTKKDVPQKAPVNKKTGQKKAVSRGGSYRDFLPIVQTIVEFLGHFRRKIRVNHLELKVILGGGDPCDLAVNYGKAWAALGNVMPQLERVFVIKKRNLEVECDFLGDKTLVFARVDATITIGRVVHLLTRHGIKILRQLLQLKKLRKGGAKL